MKRTHTLYVWLIGVVAGIAIVGDARTATAAVDITSANATVEKRDNTGTGQKEAWVVINYGISDVPASGVVLKIKATFQNPVNGTSFTDNPVTAEVTGDIGPITGDGSKKIEWNAEQTLTRLNRQGKYKCFVTLEIEGQDSVSKATLVVRKYIQAGWYYFKPGTAIIKNLRRTGTFTPSCPNVQGQSWHQTVEPGAVFYQGEVQSIPVWNGRRANDNISGTPSSSGCSAFLAVKDQGTADEKVWVNFSQLWDMVLNLEPKQFFQWEFQFRYFHKKSDGTKALKCGNAGKPGQDIWSENNQGEDFELTIESGPAESENSNTFDLEVVRRKYKHFYQGAHVMTLTTIGDGYFDAPGDNRLILTDGDLKINDWLHFSGAFQIDTTLALITTLGAWADPNGNVLWTGPYIAKLTDKIGTDLTSTFPVLSDKMKIGGVVVKFDSIQFVGGVENATGVQMDIVLQMEQLASACKWDFDKMTKGKETAGLTFKAVKLTTAGWELGGIEVSNVGLTMAPAFCLKSFKVSYDKAKEQLDAELIGAGPIFSEIGGGLSIVKGALNGFNFKMKLADGGVPVPCPGPPPEHIMEWVGFSADVKNIETGPYTLAGTAYFVNRADWERFPQFKELLKKFNATPSLLEIDGGFEYVYGQSPSMNGALRMFGIGGKFQLNGTGKVTLNLNSSLVGISGEFDVKVGTIDGTNYVFNIKGSGGLAVYPSFILNASLTGSVTIPPIPTNIPFGATFNSLFGLPYFVGSVGVGLYNTQVTFEANSATAGKRSVTVELGDLPSPTAFHWSNAAPVKSTRLKREDHALQSAGDTTWTEFPTSIDMDRVFIVVWGENGVLPATVLRNPTGAQYTATAPDSSVVYIDAPTSGANGLWVIKEPGGGNWRIGIVDQEPGDSIAIEGLYRPRPELELTTERSGDQIVAKWSTAGRTDSSEVSIFVDADDHGFDGVIVGTVPESAGEYRFALNDSLPECSYHVYAVRNTGGAISSDYSPDVFDNPKTFLTPPTSIVAIAQADGSVVVTWNPSADTNALAYLIKVTDKNGVDSIYTSVNYTYTMTQIRVADWQNKTISIRTLGDQDLRGCWSDPVNFVLADVDEPTGGRVTGGVLLTRVVPNPATDRSTIYVNLDRSGLVFVDLYSLDGTRVKPVLATVAPAGTLRCDLDASGLARGIYFVRVSTPQGNGVEKMVVE